ncbi:V-type ATP synthase subunit E [Halorhabdus rudnickae]|uniref:V-type ATP synthase subunit E n=1 Tax=Halorhabdus rudnickae TaxID=1775544 RepID=UPI00108252A3|nr:V-type ATP synthase subunit E [Halorhabdus rudnickae]
MSLETVVEDIREEARTRAEEIRAEAEEEAEEILGDAESDAEEIRDEREQEVQRQIEQEREQRLSSATLQAKQERLKARRTALESVRERVEERLATLEDDRRETLTRELLDAALEELDSSNVDVYCRPEDEALLETILEEYDASLAGQRDCLGGVVVESSSSRVRVNNTFDALVEDVWEDEVREISDHLFDEAENEREQ